jgi:DNA-binding response OmpR family regulator
MSNHQQVGQARLPASRKPKDQYGFTLTSVEGRLVAYLQANIDRVCTPSELISACQIYSRDRLVNAITALREAIEPDPRHPIYLVRIGKGEGYILHDPNKPVDSSLFQLSPDD